MVQMNLHSIYLLLHLEPAPFPNHTLEELKI